MSSTIPERLKVISCANLCEREIDLGLTALVHNPTVAECLDRLRGARAELDAAIRAVEEIGQRETDSVGG